MTGDLPNERMKLLQTKAGERSSVQLGYITIMHTNELLLFVQCYINEGQLQGEEIPEQLLATLREH